MITTTTTTITRTTRTTWFLYERVKMVERKSKQSKSRQAFDCLNGWMNWSDWVHLNFKNFNSNLNLLTWKKRKLNESVEMTMAQTHITSQWKCSVLSIQNKKEEKRIKVIEKWENRLNHILKFQATFFLTLTLKTLSM